MPTVIEETQTAEKEKQAIERVIAQEYMPTSQEVETAPTPQDSNENTMPAEAAESAVPMTTQVDNRGFEEPTDREDMIIPRAKLLQGLSPEVVENPRKYHPGMIINSLTQEPLQKELEDGQVEGATFIPILKFTEWIRFNPRNKDDAGYLSEYAPGAMIWRTKNPDDPRVAEQAQFGPNGERPVATKFMNFLAYFPGHPVPMFISFSNTSFKAGKKLYSLAKYYNVATGKPMFAKKYELTTKQESSDKGTYQVLDVNDAGLTGEADYKLAEKFYADLNAKPIEVDHSEPSAEKKKEDWA